MSLHLSPFDDLARAPRRGRKSSARRKGEVLALLFLASLGSVATLTGTPASSRAQAATPGAATAR